MSTKEELLARIAEDSSPRVGDVFRSRYSSYYKRRIYSILSVAADGGFRLWQKDPGEDWTHFGSVERENLKNEFILIDIGFSDFIAGGISPTNRPHAIFKKTAGVVYRAGCRTFTTYAQAARHWGGRRKKHVDAIWKREMARDLFAAARKKGWMKVARARPVKKARKAVRR